MQRADNSPFADRSPHHGIAEVRSGIFDRLRAGFDKLVVAVDEIFACEEGKVVVLGYYHGRFRGRAEEFKAQVAHIWTIREGRAVKFQQYLDTLRSHATRERSQAASNSKQYRVVISPSSDGTCRGTAHINGDNALPAAN